MSFRPTEIALRQVKYYEASPRDLNEPDPGTRQSLRLQRIGMLSRRCVTPGLDLFVRRFENCGCDKITLGLETRHATGDLQRL